MLKQKLKIHIHSFRALGVLAIAGIIVGATIYGGFVRADSFDEQIKQLQAQNSANRSASNQLAAQASSYQQAVDALQQRINSVQASLDVNQQKSNDLQKQIDADELELKNEKLTLGINIKAMYLEGKISTLEILASSNDLSDFVNKEEYRSAVQDKVKASVDKITALKLELQKQQTELQLVIKDLETQRGQLDADRSQQNQLLAYTEGQKAAYDAQIKSNNSQIISLRAAQLAANHRLGGNVVSGDPGHGGYPGVWDNASQDSMLDSWGMLNRECVSYTAWKVYQNYGYMPYWGGVGNANQWPGDAAAAGIPTGSTPKPGAVAISMGGAYGHAMWVESVFDNGYIYVSQYNYDLTGHYSEMTVSGAGLIYIYFQ